MSVDRKEKQRLTLEIQKLFPASPLLRESLKDFLTISQQEIDEGLHISPNWEETCKLQGKNDLLHDIKKLITILA